MARPITCSILAWILGAIVRSYGSFYPPAVPSLRCNSPTWTRQACQRQRQADGPDRWDTTRSGRHDSARHAGIAQPHTACRAEGTPAYKATRSQGDTVEDICRQDEEGLLGGAATARARFAKNHRRSEEGSYSTGRCQGSNTPHGILSCRGNAIAPSCLDDNGRRHMGHHDGTVARRATAGWSQSSPGACYGSGPRAQARTCSDADRTGATAHGCQDNTTSSGRCTTAICSSHGARQSEDWGSLSRPPGTKAPLPGLTEAYASYAIADSCTPGSTRAGSSTQGQTTTRALLPGSRNSCFGKAAGSQASSRGGSHGFDLSGNEDGGGSSGTSARRNSLSVRRQRWGQPTDGFGVVNEKWEAEEVTSARPEPPMGP